MCESLRKQIVNQVLEVRSSDAAALSDVRIAYLRFPVPELEAKTTIVVEIDDHALRGYLPVANRSIVQPLLDHPFRPWQVKALANRMVLAAIRTDHDVFHGCAVDTPAGAIAFVGGSGSGKSTLARELGRLGYPLLCEGQIPVDRVTTRVKPFPRGFEVFGDTPARGVDVRFRSQGKMTVDAGPSHSNEASGLRAVVFLQDLFPGLAPQNIELGCAPQDKPAVIEYLRQCGACDLVAEGRGQQVLIGCRFDPETGEDLERLSRGFAERGLTLISLAFLPASPPDWSRELVATEVTRSMALLGMGANASMTVQRLSDARRESGALTRFSRYLGQSRAYLLVDGSLSARTQWIMDRLPAAGMASC